MLGEAGWDGLRFQVCRENIQQPTRWAIDDARHTLIVHLGGAMRELTTEIDGYGSTHVPPSAGDIWLVPAGMRYAGRSRGHSVTYAEFQLDRAACFEAPGGTSMALPRLRPHMGHRDPFLHGATLQLSQLLGSDDDLSAMMAERLQMLIRQHLFRGYAQAAPSRQRPVVLAPAMARALGDYIEQRLDQPISLAQLAVIAGCSVHHLLIAFRKVFGTTPAQYILAQRLRRARWLLLHGGEDIGGIAMACGFASHSHLSAAFRRDCGISPSEFRRGQRTHSIVSRD